MLAAARAIRAQNTSTIMRRADTRGVAPGCPGSGSDTRKGDMKKGSQAGPARPLSLAQPAFAGDTIKIGFVSTLSGPTAVLSTT